MPTPTAERCLVERATARLLTANSGSRPAGGLLFFACAKKSNQKKAHPPHSPRIKTPGPLRASPHRGSATRHALYEAWLKQCSRKPPGGAAVLGELQRGPENLHWEKQQPNPTPPHTQTTRCYCEGALLAPVAMLVPSPFQGEG